MDSEIRRVVDEMSRQLNDAQNPNISELWSRLVDLNAIKWSVKQSGYNLGRAVYDSIREIPIPEHPGYFPVCSKASTQADVESQWFVYWMSQLRTAPLPHRKLWEYAWVLQNLESRSLLQEGRTAIGFGCGEEPLPSYFASRGVRVTVTDLSPSEVAGKGWAETSQHTARLESVFKDGLVAPDEFHRLVELQYVNMNEIPQSLDGRYDFCWSVCAMEHLGSIKQGLDFVENSLKTLKPSGLALHTTEYNFTEDERTIDNWPTVLFLRKHLMELRDRLESRGYRVAPLDFDIGSRPMDSFFDLPPYDFDAYLRYQSVAASEGFRPSHLKLSIDGFPSTCFGLAIERPA